MAAAAPPAITQANVGTCPGCKADNIQLKEVYGVPVCDKCAAKCFSEKVRQRIQEAYERQQEQRRRELWNKRVELVKKGVRSFEEKSYVDALKCFREYLQIIENHHKVGPGGLTTHLFDSQKEAGDILLIAGIYWDIAKIYDQMKGKQYELQQSLNKFVEFSLGRPHAVLSTETIRKYMKFSEPRHPEAFEQAHKVLAGSMNRCFIASAVFGPDAAETQALREFRDRVLLPSRAGRAFVNAYYVTSPAVAVWMTRIPALAKPTRAFLRALVRLISA